MMRGKETIKNIFEIILRKCQRSYANRVDNYLHVVRTVELEGSADETYDNGNCTLLSR